MLPTPAFLDPSLDPDSVLITRTLHHSWVKTLDKDFEQAGLGDVAISRNMTAVERLPCMTDLFMMAWEEMMSMVVDEGKAADLKALFPEAVAETKSGLGHDMDRVTVVGRKL